MLRKDLILYGFKLAKELDDLSKMYHVKSDKHEILGYEAYAIRGMAEEMSAGKNLEYKLLASTLLSDWGSQLVEELPDVFTSVKTFRQQYSAFEDLRQ